MDICLVAYNLSCMIGTIQLRAGFNRARERWQNLIKRYALDLAISAELFNQNFSNEEELLDAYEQDSTEEVRLKPSV